MLDLFYAIQQIAAWKLSCRPVWYGISVGHNEIGDNLYGEIGQYQQAVDNYSKAIELSPHSANFYKGRGWALGKLGQHESQISNFTEAISLEQNDTDTLCKRARAYGLTGHYQQEIDDCNAVIKLDPKNGFAYRLRGWANGKLHNYQLEIDDYTKLAAIGSADTSADGLLISAELRALGRNTMQSIKDVARLLALLVSAE